MKKLFLIFFLIVCTLLTLSACDMSFISSIPSGMLGEDTQSHTVTLLLPAGVSVVGSNSVTVEDGGEAVFELEYSNGVMFSSVTHGSYDISEQSVVIKDVHEDIEASLSVNKYDFDTSVKYRFVLNGTAKDTSSIPSGIKVNAGIVVSLKAEDMNRRFAGWTIGAPKASGGEVVSTDREYSFVIQPSLANDIGAIYFYPNYVDTNAVYYNPNGGLINTTSTNYKNAQYYTASVTTMDSMKVLRLQISMKYLSKVESHSSLYDDGTFYRSGYVLTEYNTKPDGTGESYSLGSKIYFSPDELTPTLYCIWKEATPEDKFVYAFTNMPCPVKASYAPAWQSRGVIITQYTGNDETLVIPETINGTPVIAIAKDAIVGKDTKTLVLNRRIQKVEDGAIKDCPGLRTVYFADSIYEMHNEALDAASSAKLSNIYVNATMAPRFAGTLDGSHAVKLSRLLAGEDEPRLIVIGGSSIYEGLATEYLEALLGGDYRVVNFGTTRTTHCTMYLEAMQYYANKDDVVVYAPENSAYLLGERELYWKTMRDLEGMVNIYRYVDMTQYTNFFSAFTDFNQNKRYIKAGVRYEDIINVAATDENGDHALAQRKSYVEDSRYKDEVYYHSLNNRMKSRYEVSVEFDKVTDKEDYNNPENITWCSMDDPYYLEPMNRIIRAAKSSGAKVYFGYCPVEGNGVVEAGRNRQWMRAYDALIADIYEFDGAIGKCENYIYNRLYCYDNAFHLNDYGRTYRTYQFYLDFCETLGKDAKYTIYSLGTNFDGCLFENNSKGRPRIGVDYLMEE